jgi:hypothetical protein
MNIFFKFNLIYFFQSFANKSFNRNNNSNEKSFSNKTQNYFKSKEKCKFILLIKIKKLK